MTYPTYTDYNSTDLSGILTYPASIMPSFMPLVLFALFVIILLATYFSSKRMTGKGNFPASFVASSFVTTIFAVLLSLVSGLVNTYTLVICISVFIISVIVLFFNRDSN